MEHAVGSRQVYRVIAYGQPRRSLAGRAFRQCGARAPRTIGCLVSCISPLTAILNHMNSLPFPESIVKLDGHAIRIVWSDGKIRRYTAGQLRKACPCATCREKRMAEADRPKTPLAILSEREAVVLDVMQMKPVGNYAYNLVFSDGHSSGLFTMEFLRQIGTEELANDSVG